MKQPAPESAGWRLIENSREGSSSLGDFARFDASCTNFHPARATLRNLYANRLKIRIESSGSTVVRVRDIVAELWSFTADFATFSHFYSTSRILRFLYRRFRHHTECNLAVIRIKLYSKRISKSSRRATWM